MAGRLVPWASWDEWNQVGSLLFSPSAADVQRGFDRVRTDGLIACCGAPGPIAGRHAH